MGAPVKLAYKSPGNGGTPEDFDYLHKIGSHYDTLTPFEESYLLNVLKGQPVHTLETLLGNLPPVTPTPQQAKEARDIFIAHNIRLVISMALTRKKHFEEEILHLIEEGFIGLINAVEKYELGKKTCIGASHRFSTYAFHWIRCHISKEFKKHLKPQKDKRTKIITKFNQAKKLLSELSSEVTEKDVFEFLNWSPETIKRYKAPPQYLMFRDISYIDEEEQEDYETLIVTEEPMKEHICQEEKNMVLESLQILSDEEAYTVIFHDCLSNLAITFRILSIAYEKPEKEIKEIHCKALNKLFRYMVSNHRNMIEDYL